MTYTGSALSDLILVIRAKFVVSGPTSSSYLDGMAVMKGSVEAVRTTIGGLACSSASLGA